MIEPDGPWGIGKKYHHIKFRIMVILSDGEEHTSNEIANHIGTSVEAVRSHLQKSLTSLNISSRRIDDPNDKHRMITLYKWSLNLRPCYWCNKDPTWKRTSIRGVTNYYIECKCGVRIKPYPTFSEAVWKWNMRFGE